MKKTYSIPILNLGDKFTMTLPSASSMCDLVKRFSVRGFVGMYRTGDYTALGTSDGILMLDSKQKIVGIFKPTIRKRK